MCFYWLRFKFARWKRLLCPSSGNRKCSLYSSIWQKVKGPKGLFFELYERRLSILKDADEEARKAFVYAERKFGNDRPIIQIDSALLSYKTIGGFHCITTQLNGNAAKWLVKDLKREGAKLLESDEDINL